MRTLLINPPYAYSEVPIMPMGLAYIAAALEDSGNEVQILDLLVSKCEDEKIRRKLKDYDPDIVGITCVTMNYPVASSILKVCKDTNRDITTVIGGPHVTFCPVETLNEAPWIDIIVRGEGDLTVLDIVRGKKLEEIDGIAFRSDGVKLNEPRQLIQDLDQLPQPARHLFPLSRYLALECHFSVIAGRGCPFNCIFCVGSKMGGRRARYRDPRLVVDEIEQALEWGFKHVNLEDDLLTLNHRHLYRFCDEIISRGLKLDWSAFSRVDTVDLPLLTRMQEAGCKWLLYGVESGNQGILDTVEKKITLDKIREAVRLAGEAGVNVMASFIIGLPGETRETIRETIEFARELKTSWGFNVLAPFPGPEVRERAAEYGIEILTSDWLQYDANTAVSRTKGAGPQEIGEAMDIYDRELKNYLADLAKAGSTGLTADEKDAKALASVMLQADTIESIGPLRNSGDPAADLAMAVAGEVDFPAETISETIRNWVGQGLLKHEARGEHCFWEWN